LSKGSYATHYKRIKEDLGWRICYFRKDGKYLFEKQGTKTNNGINIQKEDACFKYFTPHIVRHTFSSRAIENGMQPKTLQCIFVMGYLK